jgi:hypothetical protein
MGLGVALTFRQLAHPERDFGKVRLWGTVGWAAACLVLGGLLALGADLASSIRLGAVFALAFGVYAVTLPHTPPSPRSTRDAGLRCLFDAPLLALRLLRQRSFAIYCICLFGTMATLPFTVQINPLLLRDLAVPEEWIAPALTIAQSSEIATLALLPWFLSRWRLKATMVAGIASWTLGLLFLAWGQPLGLVLAALATHGVYICCFCVAGQVFVNRHAGHHFRASAQGMMQLISGLGLLSGHVLVGWLRQQTADNFALTYLAPALGSVALVVIFAMGFAGQDATRPARLAD